METPYLLTNHGNLFGNPSVMSLENTVLIMTFERVVNRRDQLMETDLVNFYRVRVV